VAFLALNSGLSILNRWALGLHGFDFPLLLTATHMLFGTCALSPLMLLHEKYYAAHAEMFKLWPSLALIGVLNGVQIAANNASLAYIELSLNQVIRAFGPLVVASVAIVVEGKVATRPETAALLTIACGVGLTVFREATSDKTTTFGVVLTLASILVQSLILSISGRVMAGTKLDGLQMAFYLGPFGFVILLPLGLSTELGKINRALSEEPIVCTAFLLGSCILAVAYNVVVFQSSHTLSSVGTAVLANLKIVLLFALSAVVLGEMASWRLCQFVGCTLTFGGTAIYTRARLSAAQRRKAMAAEQRKAIEAGAVPTEREKLAEGQTPINR
jgi:drug/metabolite transporter (DMT)-like permease